jgi:hypothetical protein
MGRSLLKIATLVSVPAIGFGYYYRPVGDNDLLDTKSGPKRAGIMISPQGLCDRADIAPPLLYRVASGVIISVTSSLSRIFLYGCGRFDVKKDDNYNNFISQVRQREPGVPLITVCVLFQSRLFDNMISQLNTSLREALYLSILRRTSLFSFRGILGILYSEVCFKSINALL